MRKPDLIRGGQGRTPEQVERDAATAGFCGCFAVLLVVAAVAMVVLERVLP